MVVLLCSNQLAAQERSGRKSLFKNVKKLAEGAEDYLLSIIRPRVGAFLRSAFQKYSQMILDSMPIKKKGSNLVIGQEEIRMIVYDWLIVLGRYEDLRKNVMLCLEFFLKGQSIPVDTSRKCVQLLSSPTAIGLVKQTGPSHTSTQNCRNGAPPILR